MTPIPRSYFDTSSLPRGVRLKQWRDAATPVWDIVSVDAEGFRSVVDLYHGGNLVFGTVASSAQATERGMARIVEDGIDYYAFQFYTAGFRRSVADGREAVLNRGDLLTVDMTQPVATTSTRYRSLDLGVPRRLLAPLLDAPDAHGGRRHAATNPLTALLRAHVSALYQAAPQMSLAQMEAMQEATIALTAATLNGLVTEEHAAQVRTATLLAIRRHIEDRLADLRLSALSVAQHFAISRATLYRIMDPLGGFAVHVRRRRLDRVRQDLGHAANSHRSIAEIAEAWGFSSHSAFTKSFRACFGMTPRDYRAIAVEAHAEGGVPSGANAWSHWLAAMK